ncbi:MAG: F0F1 ATP synthase subunit A [Saprospiraceae bacterium]|nr:F0F1 ATP synthase subunit A [Saprospiraceae bacterium]MDW8484910.1 F0F1 ATP synthase subunit A [Saprospiraceae bacterium]
MAFLRIIWIILIFNVLGATGRAQSTEHAQQFHAEKDAAYLPEVTGARKYACGRSLDEAKPFDAGEAALHHIADANAIHIVGDIYFPLPCFLYAPGYGWKITTTAAFEAYHHGNGTRSIDGYVLVQGTVMRIRNPQYACGTFQISDYTQQEIETESGKKKTIYYAIVNGRCEPLDAKTTFDGGIMGGGITSFYDFSITRNVFTMLLTALLLFLLFRAAVRSAKRNQGKAPRGLQNFLEPFVVFIRDEVAKPNIGPKHERYLPYLLAVFFFILGLNLIGQVPFFPGGANVTGNISVTLVLAIFTFLITIFSANKHYWEHTLWMPGVPALLKILILTPIEILGLLLKPFTLLLRLFANITAGHIVILSFVGLIFIFGKEGQSLSGSLTGILTSVPLTLFMMTLELLVAFLQAFIFTMLSAVYIGAAVEESEHH